MSNTAQIWLDVAALILKYGIPAVRDIITAWSEDLTPEQIVEKARQSRADLKRPEDYFKTGE